MKTVALISGGKDSCYNMMQCIQEGHCIVALANLKPKHKDELDSYMYQSVGHHAIDLYAEAMNLPLYRREIAGTSKSTQRDYEPTHNDEVEDLYALLKTVKEEMSIEAVSVGAILSNYQRVRVENVCQRLGLIPLAYLWRRDQVELLEEMIQCRVEAVLIKVAALGLHPKQHLGKSLSEMKDHLHKKNAEFELNVCGEGGEYETFTLDCPLFMKKIVLDETELVIHSDDAFAPVGYLNLRRTHLEDKHMDSSLSQLDMLKGLPMKHSRSLLREMFPDESELRCGSCERLQRSKCSDKITEFRKPELYKMKCHELPDSQHVCVTGLVAIHNDVEDVTTVTRHTMDRLKEIIKPLDMSSLVLVHLYVRQMDDFAAINSVYKTYFGLNPAGRVCVEAELPDNVSLMIDCYGNSCHRNRETMHVQGLSHWAPANIGPYSQCVKVNNLCFVAGQIGMVPANLALISGGIHSQARLSLLHVNSVLSAMSSGCSIDDITTCVCYVTHPDYIAIAREELSTIAKDHACVPVYVIIPRLPKGAVVEWQVVARTDISKPLKVERKTKCKGDIYTGTANMIYSCDSTPLSLVVSIYITEGVDISSIDVDLVVALLKECIVMFTTMLDNPAPLSDNHPVPVSDNHPAPVSDSPVSLLRIFYPAHVFKFDEISEALQKTLSSLPVAVVPVTRLETNNAVITLCQSFI